MIKTNCKECKGTKQVLDPEGTGKQIRCPSCGGQGFQLSKDSRG